MKKQMQHIIFSNGGEYLGELADHLPHGQGTCTFPDGTKYVGEHKNGNRHGPGTYTFPDGQEYVGAWKNGNFTKGRQTFIDNGPVMDLSTTGQRIISEEEID